MDASSSPHRRCRRLAAAADRALLAAVTGGYVELGSRIVILALAAMALNFLLGYTGVLSFGHAAYFGLGAYGTAMIIKYLFAEHAAGDALRHCRRHGGRGHHRPADRAPARRLFRHVHDRLRPGVLFHRFPVARLYRRRRRSVSAGIACRSISASRRSTSSTTTRRSITLCWRCSPSPSRSWRSCCARRSAARCWRSARTSAARASSAFRSTGTSGCPG